MNFEVRRRMLPLSGHRLMSALIVMLLAALGSAGLMAAGHLSNRPETAERGKRAFLWAVGSVIAAALAIPLVNTVFGAAS